MKHLSGWGASVLCLAATALQAAQGEFSVVNMDVNEARSCPGGYGGYGQFQLAKPEEVKKTPKCASAHPLYARMVTSGRVTQSMLFLLDESGGTGKGYDRLIADLNRNGDLSDDPPSKKAAGDREMVTEDFEQGVFGPLELAAEQAVGPWRPRFFAEIYLYNKSMIRQSEQAGAAAGENFPLGQLRVMTGNYLVTTVDLEGVRQKVGLVDGNCNFTLGDGVQSLSVQRSAQGPQSWYLNPGDYYLRDRDGSGKFEERFGHGDAEPFSRFIYFGQKPYTAKLATDLRAVEFEPYAGPVGELQLAPEITEILLGWSEDGSTEHCEALTPSMETGKAIVPAGTARIASCVVGAKDGAGHWVRTQSREVPDRKYAVESGKTTALVLGRPLALEATAEETRAAGQDMSVRSTVRRMFGGSDPESSKALLINVVVSGAGGERYSGFVEEGQAGSVPPPKFEVVGPDGKQLAAGKLEYG